MLQLERVLATGADFRAGALHLSSRLGFTLSRGEEENHLRIVLQEGFIDLRRGPEEWQWERFFLRPPSRPGENRTEEEAGSRAGGSRGTVLPEHALPVLLPAGPVERPQAQMEPERAAAVVRHANSVTGLAGVMLLVPELEPAVRLYEELLGTRAGPSFSDSALGVTGHDLPLAGGARLGIVAATMGTGPAARYRVIRSAGLIGVMLRVGSVRTAADCLRNGRVYSFLVEGRLVTSSALPGFGLIMFEEQS